MRKILENNNINMDTETKVLQENIQKQVNRLVQQLNDLEELTKEAGMDQEEIE